MDSRRFSPLFFPNHESVLSMLAWLLSVSSPSNSYTSALSLRTFGETDFSALIVLAGVLLILVNSLTIIAGFGESFSEFSFESSPIGHGSLSLLNKLIPKAWPGRGFIFRSDRRLPSWLSATWFRLGLSPTVDCLRNPAWLTLRSLGVEPIGVTSHRLLLILIVFPWMNVAPYTFVSRLLTPLWLETKCLGLSCLAISSFLKESDHIDGIFWWSNLLLETWGLSV